MFLIALFLSEATADCSQFYSINEFNETLDSMSYSFANRDIERLTGYITQSQEQINCLNELTSPTLSVRYHTLRGLYSWIIQDNEAAISSFSVVKQIEPEASISPLLFPEDHDIHNFFADVNPAEMELLRVAPHTEILFFDGREMIYRPLNAPTIFQIQQDNKIVFSSYLTAQDELPDLQSIREVQQQKEEPKKSQPKIQKHHYIAAVSAVLMGTSFATADTFRNQYKEDGHWIHPPSDMTEPNSLYFSNNVSFYSSITTLGIAGYLWWKHRKGKRQ